MFWNKAKQPTNIPKSATYLLPLTKHEGRVLLSLVGQVSGAGPREVTDAIWERLQNMGLENPNYLDGENGKKMVRIRSGEHHPLWLEWRNQSNPPCPWPEVSLQDNNPGVYVNG